jgi:putative polyhydroxyalkanoate system protein
MSGTHPISVELQHRLGKDEALQRLKSGLARLVAKYPAELAVGEEKWTGDGLQFRVAILGQTTTGAIKVGERDVRVDVALSWLMAHQAGAAEAMIKREGAAMLGNQ